MTTSPTQRSLKRLRDDGWLASVVEHRVPGGPGRPTTTRDLFGFIDILAIKGDTTLAVQTTTSGNAASRLRKIADAEHLGAVREAGWRIEVHGWMFSKRSRRWECRVTDVS